MMTAAVWTEGLTKYYGKVVGVEDLNLEIQPGEVFGYLGPNGAGKTTTLRVLMGFLRPTRGRGEIFGHDVTESSEAVREKVGYLPGDLRVYEGLTAAEYLDHLAGLRGVGENGQLRQLAERLNLDLGRRIGELSKGNRQKIGLVQAFMHEPELLLLDEPTSGLDPLMQRTFYELVTEAKDRGATIVLSSHVLAEVERVADRVGVIRQGRLVVLEEMDALKARLPRDVVIRFSEPAPATLLEGLERVEQLGVEADRISLRVEGPLGPVMGRLAQLGLSEKVMDINTHEPQLEDVFMTYYEAGDGTAVPAGNESRQKEGEGDDA